jgi:hypothetical protein
MLSSGLLFAEENGAFSRTFTTAKTDFSLGYGNSQLAGDAIDKRIIDRLGLFEAPDSDKSSRYSVEVDLENEDSDWSFEVTVTVEF